MPKAKLTQSCNILSFALNSDDRRRSSASALCPTPILTNGEIQAVGPLRVGSRIQFRCDQGYQLNGATSTTCVEARGGPQWQPEPPTCLQGKYFHDTNGSPSIHSNSCEGAIRSDKN